MILDPRLIAGVGGVGLVIGALAGWTVRDWKADADQLAAVQKADKVKAELQAKADTASGKLEDFLARQQATAITDRNTIREIYHETKVPAECAAPAATVSLLDGARNRANAAATGQLEAPVPAASAAAQPLH